MIAHAFRALRGYLRTPAARSAEDFGNAIEEEIAFHVSARTCDYMAVGMPEEDAARAALARFGDASRVAAECHAGAVGGLVVWHQMHLALTAALAVAVAGLWLAPSGLRRSASQVPPGIASMLDNDWTGDISGQIRDEQGNAIEAAQVLVVVKTWPDQSYFQRAYQATSDGNGRFLIKDVHPINEKFEVQIAAVAKNRALKSSYHTAPGGTLEPVMFDLFPSSGMALQVESEQGATLTGVEVLPHGRVEANGVEHVVYFDSAQSLVRRTDDGGRVEFPYFQPGDTARVLLRISQGDWEPRDFVVPAAGKIITIRVSPRSEEPSKES